MHCRSCELLIEQHVGKVPGVEAVHVDHHTGVATVRHHETSHPSRDQIARAVQNAGYQLGDRGPIPFISHSPVEWTDALVAACFVLILFLLYRILGLNTLGASLTTATGPLSALVIGLLAGVSTCMALVGGLVLSLSARHAQRNPSATVWEKFRPHLAFNFGRIASFAVLGGVVGIIGSGLRITSSVSGWLIIIAGLTMLALGISLTGLFPRMRTLSLPSGIARRLGISTSDAPYRHHHAAALGMATFFLPCAFTQTMQLYAASTGSFTQGSLVMAAFALGTTPGLLGVGSISSLMRGSTGRMVMKTAGILVLLLGFWNVSNGWNLTGLSLVDRTATVTANDPGILTARIQGSSQYITTEQNQIGYNPNRMQVKVGVPVVWTLNSVNSYTCASSIVIPSLRIQRNLQPGPNTITFTPTKTGIIRFSCAMGMFTGSINVVN